MGDVNSLMEIYKLICEQLSMVNKCGDKNYYLNHQVCKYKRTYDLKYTHTIEVKEYITATKKMISV